MVSGKAVYWIPVGKQTLHGSRRLTAASASPADHNISLKSEFTCAASLLQEMFDQFPGRLHTGRRVLCLPECDIEIAVHGPNTVSLSGHAERSALIVRLLKYPRLLFCIHLLFLLQLSAAHLSYT